VSTGPTRSTAEPAPGESVPEEDRSWRPSWLYLAPFLGAAPPLTRRQWRVLGLVSLVTLFEQYDIALFSLALKQIQGELAIAEAQLGNLGAVVRLGALPAFLVALFADRVGRRRMLLVTIVGYTALTGATAFAPDARTFVALQFLARVFAVAEGMLAYVVVAEELDADVRGWGIGALGALAACGHGLALALFSAIDVLPFGWRALYLTGLGPLVWLAWMRRTLPETARFEAQASAAPTRATLRSAGQPVAALLRMYPGRFAALAAVVFLLNFAENAAGFFGPKYFQEEHGWSPARFAALGFFGGALGIFGSAFAGRLSDRRGRRRIAIAFLLAHPLFVIAYYQLAGPVLPVLWIASVFAGIGGGVLLAAFGNEMFPTSYRSTAAGARVIVGTAGGVLGLAAESLLYAALGSHWNAICLLAACALAAPLIVFARFPETAGRRLEEISPER
jgi:MFS family permease